MEYTPDEFEALLQSYKMHLQYEENLGKGVVAFHSAAEKLSPEDSDKIREILACIADQFSLISQEDKDSRMDTLNEDIQELASIKIEDLDWNREINGILYGIFKNLSEIPPSLERTTHISVPRRAVYHCH